MFRRKNTIKSGIIVLSLTATITRAHAVENGDIIRSTEPVPHFAKAGYNLKVVQCSNKKGLGFFLAGKTASKIKKTRSRNYYAWINRAKTYYFPQTGKIGFRKEKNNHGYSARLSSGAPKTMICR